MPSWLKDGPQFIPILSLGAALVKAIAVEEDRVLHKIAPQAETKVGEPAHLRAHDKRQAFPCPSRNQAFVSLISSILLLES